MSANTSKYRYCRFFELILMSVNHSSELLILVSLFELRNTWILGFVWNMLVYVQLLTGMQMLCLTKWSGVKCYQTKFWWVKEACRICLASTICFLEAGCLISCLWLLHASISWVRSGTLPCWMLLLDLLLASISVCYCRCFA